MEPESEIRGRTKLRTLNHLPRLVRGGWVRWGKEQVGDKSGPRRTRKWKGVKTDKKADDRRILVLLVV